MIDKSQAGHPYIKGTSVPADRGDLDFVIRLRSGPSTASAPWCFLLLLKRVTVSAGPGIGVGRLYEAASANWRQTKHREYDCRMKSITHARV